MTAAAVAHDGRAREGRWRALALLSAAVVLAMTTWFSASAVVPQLRADWGLGATAAAWLTIAVQLGFVAGATIVERPQPRGHRLAARRPPRRRCRRRAVANALLAATDGPGAALSAPLR